MEDQIFGGSVGVPKTDCASGGIFGKVSSADLDGRDKQISGIKRCGTVRILRTVLVFKMALNRTRARKCYGFFFAL